MASAEVSASFGLHPVGYTIGADLFFYVTIPGLAFALTLLLSRARELERRSTLLVRELALLRSQKSAN